ncbi:hypothetical protein Tco_1519420, partial [Tanacetum coccineum]
VAKMKLNQMIMKSKVTWHLGVGYGPRSLLEQWRDTLVDDEYDPYDDDMNEGQEVPKNIHNICDNFDIKVRGRKMK